MKAIIFLIAFLLFLSFPIFTPVLAVSVSITNFPANINDQPFTITASVSGAATGTNYLRIDLYKEGTQNYFGHTHNGSDWYSGSEGNLYFPINITSGSFWTGDVQAKVGSPNSNDYNGQGNYKMRVRRYTQSGNLGGEDPNASSVSVNINIPTVTPIPSNTPTPKSTSTPTSKPTSTITPLPLPSKTPTSRPTIANLLSPSPMQQAQDVGSQSLQVLGSSIGKKDIPSDKTAEENKEPINTGGLIGGVFIILGIVFLVLCGIVIAWSYKKSKQQ